MFIFLLGSCLKSCFSFIGLVSAGFIPFLIPHLSIHLLIFLTLTNLRTYESTMQFPAD